MNLVFLNSFERKAGNDRVINAQVSIAEEYGEWRVRWDEPGQDGESTQESWYTGTAWYEMLQQFRDQIARKREEGFYPLVEFARTTKDRFSMEGKSKLVRKQEWYGEQHADPALYEALRQWRNARAAKDGKVPYIVATNLLLKMIAAFVPKTSEELLQLPGFGEQKAAAYADDIIALTAAADRQTAFPLHWVDQAADDDTVRIWLHGKQEERRLADAEKQQQKRALLQAIADGCTLSVMEQQLGLSRRELVTRMEELGREGYELEPLLAVELDHVPKPMIDKAWQTFGSIGDRVLRPVLQKLYDEKALDEQALSHTYEWLRLLRIRYRNSKAEQSA